MNNIKNISAVIPTIGDRSRELERVILSLINQTLPPMEIIIVDQNEKDIISPIVQKFGAHINIQHVQTKKSGGISWARNIGWKKAKGDIIIFPDDDCWYPDNYFLDSMNTMIEKKVDFVTGRSAEEITLKSINASYQKKSEYINRFNAWFTSIEWTIFLKKDILIKLDGFDETLGVGAPTRWGSAEGQDLVIRSIDSGYKGYFNYNIYGHHHIVTLNPKDKKNVQKLISYARGTGRVFKINNYKIFAILMCIRPLVKIPLYILKFDFLNIKSRIYISYANFEGYFSNIDEK